MLFLISLAVAVLTAFLLDRPLKKHPVFFYITASVLTAVSVIIVQSGADIQSRFIRDYVLGIFSRGALGAAFWAVVMWAGALPNGSAPIKRLMPVRGELSITAAILTLSHIIPYGMQYISNYIRGRTGSDFAVTSTVSIVMVLIMVPLTVMSFKAVRRKMNAKTWKKIQRFAYVFYALIYVHIMVLFVPKARSGREGYFLSVLVYSAVFAGYAVMRIRKYNIARKKPDPKLVPNIVSLCAIVLTIVVAASISRSTKTEEVRSEAGENAAVFTFAPETTATTTASTVSQKDASETTAVTETTDTSSDTVTETSASSDESTAEENAESSTETTAAPSEATAEESNNEEPAPEQPEEAQPEPEPEVTYRYRNGEYEAEADGYAGKVHVKLTIENDIITSISAWADDDDTEYFGDAMNTVIPQIASKVSADGIDACSGATYSSKGIIEAARKALEQAMN